LLTKAFFFNAAGDSLRPLPPALTPIGLGDSFNCHIRLHENQALCKALVADLTTKYQLEMKQSNTLDAGSGLFTRSDVPANREVFHADPLIAIPQSEKREQVCDYYFKTWNGLATFHPVFDALNKSGVNVGSSLPPFQRCGGCGVVYYCSKVCHNLHIQQAENITNSE
jgi:hypothetical protein